MSRPPRDRPGCPAGIAELERIHEDLLYLMECLLEDICGEFKTELPHVIDAVRASPTLPAAISSEIADALAEVLRQMRAGDRAMATNLLIHCRHRLRNTILVGQQLPPAFPGHEIFGGTR